MKQYNVELLFTFCLSVFINFDVANGLSDGFSCDYGYLIDQLASCYMDYFGFNHVTGFNGHQRSVLDLEPIFSFVKNYTGCDLINEPNSKCKRKRKKGKWRSYIDRNGNSPRSDKFSNKIPPRSGMLGHLKVKSKHNFVTIFYKEDDGEDEIFSLWKTSYGHFPGDDGPDFPRPKYPINFDNHHSFKVEKRGRFNPTYKIEINIDGVAQRVLLILTGKSKLWFRVHCYDCGAWVEVKSNCKERVVKYLGERKESSDESVNYLSTSDSSSTARLKHHESTRKIIHVPLHFEDGCTLWKGGSTEETSHQEREQKDTKKLSKTKKKAKVIKRTKTAESPEIMTTTEVALVEPKSKTFIDWILPPELRRAVKKIPSTKHS